MADNLQDIAITGSRYSDPTYGSSFAYDPWFGGSNWNYIGYTPMTPGDVMAMGGYGADVSGGADASVNEADQKEANRLGMTLLEYRQQIAKNAAALAAQKPSSVIPQNPFVVTVPNESDLAKIESMKAGTAESAMRDSLLAKIASTLFGKGAGEAIGNVGASIDRAIDPITGAVKSGTTGWVDPSRGVLGTIYDKISGNQPLTKDDLAEITVSSRYDTDPAFRNLVQSLIDYTTVIPPTTGGESFTLGGGDTTGADNLDEVVVGSKRVPTPPLSSVGAGLSVLNNVGTVNAGQIGVDTSAGDNLDEVEVSTKRGGNTGGTYTYGGTGGTTVGTTDTVLPVTDSIDVTGTRGGSTSGPYTYSGAGGVTVGTTGGPNMPGDGTTFTPVSPNVTVITPGVVNTGITSTAGTGTAGTTGGTLSTIGGIPKQTGTFANLAPRDVSGIDWLHYGFHPEVSFFQNVPERTSGLTETQNKARGGRLAVKKPRMQFAVMGPGTGRSDDIPARLSDGEYVIDAETVALLGDGSSKAGAKKLDQFRVNIRKQKGRNLAKGKFSVNARRPEAYMAGGNI
jgi:hypothetical protein